MKTKIHQTVRIAVGRSTAEKMSSWRASYSRVRCVDLDDEQLILRALEALRYLDIDVAESYRKSVLEEIHLKESLDDARDSLRAYSLSDKYMNMDVCPERFYTVTETMLLLGVSRSLLTKLEDRGTICRASVSKHNEVLFLGEDIIKARSIRIPRRGKYKKH